jgi:DNA mismatch repair ATPase MutS
MDEVGRGTTVKDGLAISFATLHHLASVNKSRCLFATHFHELADMVGCDGVNGEELFRSIRYYCSDINDTEVSLYSNNHRFMIG